MNRFNLPNPGFGLGLRDEHFETVLAERPNSVDWFEVISENYLDAHQGYRDFLLDIRQSWPVILHGVSLSIGSPDPLDKSYLAKLKKLADVVNPPWLSDHLCWTSLNAHNTHDLLPVLYTEDSLHHIADKLKQVQDVLGRVFALENPSTYLEYADSTIPEADFIARLAEISGCALLLDINNVHVSSFNHGLDSRAYLARIPMDHVVQIHLAGHHDYGTHIIDTHDHPVADPVWDLYAETIARHGPIATMIEWDAHIPEFPVLVAELDKARQYAMQRIAGQGAAA